MRHAEKLVLYALLTVVLILAAKPTSAQQIVYNYMPGTDFLKYHTFKWIQIPSNVHPNQIINQEITDAINNTLTSKASR